MGDDGLLKGPEVIVAKHVFKNGFRLGNPITHQKTSRASTIGMSRRIGKRVFIANARGNQSSFYNGLDMCIHSKHIHACMKCVLDAGSGPA
jgi:hypothetical protein